MARQSYDSVLQNLMTAMMTRITDVRKLLMRAPLS